MRYEDVPKFTRGATYGVDIAWHYLEEHLARQMEDEFDADPDFQRAHVWTEQQQIRYVEYKLRGGAGARDIYTNCPGWNHGRVGNYVLVDGKQRLTAVLRFLRNEIPVFGAYRLEFTDPLRHHHSFRWWVNDLETRAEVLQWYLDFNTGGVVHTAEEIERVRALLAAEKGAA